jgi:hypothetical protein
MTPKGIGLILASIKTDFKFVSHMHSSIFIMFAALRAGINFETAHDFPGPYHSFT